MPTVVALGQSAVPPPDKNKNKAVLVFEPLTPEAGVRTQMQTQEADRVFVLTKSDTKEK